jgi:acetoin utilization protein AcuB
MMISDVMKTNVVSVPSNTTLAEARRIMNTHKIRRLPVIDKTRLVGIVTIEDLDKMGPSKLTTFSVNELIFMLNKITVQDVMHQDVVTVPPETTIEEAVAIAQSHRIGSLLIRENDRIIGIATTNDIFLEILNPLLGIGLPGSRILIVGCYQGPEIEKVLSVINQMHVQVTNLFVSDFPETGKHDLMLHLSIENPAEVVDVIRKLGFNVIVRKR